METVKGSLIPVHVFVRHTTHSHGKFRPDWFSYEECFKNLMSIMDENSKLTVFFDGDPTNHFVNEYNVNIVRIDEGTETKSFTDLINQVLKLELSNDDIIYFVEDDYIHKPNSLNILREVFKQTNVDYASLYDHPDKYLPGYYQQFAQGFQVQLFPTKSVHWRTTPSTTNTFAMKFSTLKRDYETHLKHSNFEKVGPISHDHAKFCELWNSGKSLVTPIPGYSTHVENEMLSPCTDWIKVLNETTTNV